MHLSINDVELLAVQLFICSSDTKIFLFCSVLVKTDNTTAVAYINRRRGLRSVQLHTLVHRLIVWSSKHFLSLKDTGILNHGADLPSRGNPLNAEWRLVASLVLEWYGWQSVDQHKGTCCPRPAEKYFLPIQRDSVGLACEWFNLKTGGLCPGVIETI